MDALQHVPSGSLLHSMPSPVLLINADMTVVQANQLAAHLVGRELLGQQLTELADDQDRAVMAAYLRSLLDETSEGSTRFLSCGCGLPDGRRIDLGISGSRLRTATGPLAVLSLSDLTVQRQREAELDRLAHTDALTGLPNRRAFHTQLREVLSSGEGCVVALADVDRFKLVNDQLGHQAGDDILVEVASRLRDTLPAGTTVARLGGDEFAVLMPGRIDEEGLRQLEALREIVLPAERFAGGLERVSLSIGVTHTTAGDEDDIIRQCDTAMYGAKKAGRAQIAVYGEKTLEVLPEAGSIAALVEALRRDNERLHHEARTDARTGLANSRALAELEGRVVGEQEGQWESCGVVFIDIDRFGDFNHLYGDHAGDQALRSIAAAIRKAGRKTDLAFRKGGEEFVMVLPFADRDAVGAICARVESCIAELSIPHAKGPTGWLSALVVGVALAPGESVGAAMKRAGDQAMRCKTNGIRARVVLA